MWWLGHGVVNGGGGRKKEEDERGWESGTDEATRESRRRRQGKKPELFAGSRNSCRGVGAWHGSWGEREIGLRARRKGGENSKANKEGTLPVACVAWW